MAADDRRAAGDRRLDQLRPVALLVPGQQVAGQREHGTSAEQRQPDHPVQLARAPVGAEQHDLQQVQAGDDDQRRRAEAVQAAHEPAERQLVLDVSDRRPGAGHRRRVRGRQEDAGHRLQHEQPGGDGAERVPEAGAARDLPAADRSSPSLRGRCDRPASRASSRRVAGFAGVRPCAPRSSDRLSLGGADPEALVAHQHIAALDAGLQLVEAARRRPAQAASVEIERGRVAGAVELARLARRSRRRSRGAGRPSRTPGSARPRRRAPASSEPSVTLSSRSQASSRGPTAVTRSGLPGLTSRSPATRSGACSPPPPARPRSGRGEESEAGDDGEAPRVSAPRPAVTSFRKARRSSGGSTAIRDERRIARSFAGVKATSAAAILAGGSARFLGACCLLPSATSARKEKGRGQPRPSSSIGQNGETVSPLVRTMSVLR